MELKQKFEQRVKELQNEVAQTKTSLKSMETLKLQREKVQSSLVFLSMV